jgi:hypothetical protein
MSRWIEFFEGEKNRLSMSRLLCFMAFFPSAYVVCATKTDDALGWFLGAYVLGYVGGKTADAMRGGNGKKKAN